MFCLGDCGTNLPPHLQHVLEFKYIKQSTLLIVIIGIVWSFCSFLSVRATGHHIIGEKNIILSFSLISCPPICFV